MKKLITTITLLTLMALSFAQTDVPATKNEFVPAGPGSFGPYHPQMGRMDGKRDFHKRDGEFGRKDHDQFGPRMFEYLEMTDEQIEKFHDIKVKYDKMEIDVKADQKKLGIDKRESMKDMDFSKARKVTKEMAEVRTKLQLMKIDQKEELSKILTKEQLEKFKKMHLMREGIGRKNNKVRKNNKMK